MASLNLRVGASIDRNLQVAFQPLVEAAKRAKIAIEAESKRSAKAISTETKKGVDKAEDAFKALEAEIASNFTRSAAKAGAAAKQFGREASTSFGETKRNFADMARDVEKQLASMERAQKKFVNQNFGGAIRGLAGRAASGAWQAAGGGRSSLGGAAGFAAGMTKRAVGAAVDIAKDLARSTGADLDLGSIASKNVGIESLAQDIANSGYIASDTRNSSRVRKEDLIREALDVGEKTGSNANVALEGLGKFVSKTGDLRTGRDILSQMAVYSKATGSSMEDMMDAAGDLANQLDGVENKGKAVQDLMRGFVGQGKLGAVEIKDLAAQMSKIGAASVRFEGGSSVLAEMGVLAQSARGRGGSASASSAANAVASFAAIFGKGSRLDAFEKMGVNVEGKGGKVRDPKAIIMDAMLAAQTHAGGNLGKQFDKNLYSMFADVKSQQAIGSFVDKYKSAGGGQAGLEAASAEFERLRKAIVADEEVMASFNRAMKTSESQAEVFNNQIRKSVLQMQTDLAPAMAQLAVATASAVTELAKWVTFMTGDKQGAVISSLANEDVAAAITSTEKMTAGGKISDAQIEQNRVAANEAREAKNRAEAELNVAKETLSKKLEGGDYNSLTNPLFANKADDANSFWGRLLGANEEGDRKNVSDKEAALRSAQETLDKITANNDEVKRALAGKLLVQIANVEELKSAVAPSVGSDGRRPSPEQPKTVAR